MLQRAITAWFGSQWRPDYSHIPSWLLQKQVKHWQRSLSVTHAKCSKSHRISRKENLSEKKLSRHFVDHRKVCVTGGKGGDGITCFFSEPRKEFGGPSGGDGGDGGHIIFKVDQQVKSLSSLLPFYKGFSGEKGGSKNCFGSGGRHLYVKVLPGIVNLQIKISNKQQKTSRGIP